MEILLDSLYKEKKTKPIRFRLTYRRTRGEELIKELVYVDPNILVYKVITLQKYTNADIKL
jgi:hypothetical protein